MKPIGGFIELEICAGAGNSYHGQATALWCARACLSLIVKKLRPRRVFVPFYTCDSSLEPLIDNNIEFSFYNLDASLEIESPPALQTDDFIVYINYFGLKESYVFDLLSQYGQQLIVDNTQSFFSRSYEDAVCSFNSARKFFGVPDGGYLYAPFEIEPEIPRNTEISCTHLINRVLGKQEQSYREFLANESEFDSTVKGISLLSERILNNLDYEAVAAKRRENFSVYHEAFEKINRLRVDFTEYQVPFCYPLLLDEPLDKPALYRQNIFVSTLWTDVLSRAIEEKDDFSFERRFAENLSSLPIDQRYDSTDCERVIDAIKKLIERRG